MSKKRKVRYVIPPEELPVEALFKSLHEGADLPCALTGGAYVENATGSLLEAAMTDDPKANGPEGLLNSPTGILSPASARADMCFCLGLINMDVYKNAKQIAFIRNQFAHSHVPTSFDNDEIGRECKRLCVRFAISTGKSTESHVPVLEVIDQKTTERILSTARRRFVLAVICTFLSIHHSIFNQYVEDEKGVPSFRPRKRPLVPPTEHYPKITRYFTRDGQTLAFGPVVLLDE